MGKGRLASVWSRLRLRLARTRLRRFALYRGAVDAVLFPADLFEVIAKHRKFWGRYPNLIAPRRFNDHLQRRKLFGRRRIHTLWADKLRARDFVRDRIGEKYLIPLLWSGGDLADLDPATLPDEFIIKANHGWANHLIVRDKSALDWAAARRESAAWLRSNRSFGGGEWQYRWIEPRLMVEALLTTPDGAIPPDFRVYVFHGRVAFFQVTYGRFVDQTKSLYDREFRKMPVKTGMREYPHEHPRPACLDEMIAAAETLAAGEAFLRVDFYDVGEPKFGEITLTPNTGQNVFDPPEFDLHLGRLWRDGRAGGVPLGRFGA